MRTNQPYEERMRDTVATHDTVIADTFTLGNQSGMMAMYHPDGWPHP